MDIKHFYITVMAVFLVVFAVPACAFQGSISITGSTELGGNITITCSWTLSQDEYFLNVLLRSLPAADNGRDYYYQFNQGVPGPSLGSQYNDRMTSDTFNSSDQRAVVRIRNLECSDEKTYSCYFAFTKPGSQINNTERTSLLTVRARPKIPSITLNSIVSTTTDILESSNISAVCASNVGRLGLGNLQWKIYRNSDPDIIQPSDPRLDASKNVSLAAGEASCTQRVEQTFRMQVSRSDQNLTVACFVQNSDFQSQIPDKCNDPATNFCAQTQSLRIVYGVNENDMILPNPPEDVYEDDTLTLSCSATGLPAPDYTWTQIVDDNSTTTDNNTFSGKMVDDTNQLEVPNLGSHVGQRLKFICTATNIVLGKTYSAAKEVVVRVSKKPTTTMTTTTKSTLTTIAPAGESNVTKGAVAQAGNKDDDPKTTIIIVVVVVGSVLIIALIVGIIFWRRRRSKKEIEEPSEKPYNNRTNLSYQSSQPDLVADKKFTSPSLDSSFSEKKEDGLMYADLTYDNKPRSRKPMAITDSSSEYSDIQMPQV